MEQQQADRKRDRAALGWFALGALAGAVALAGALTLTGAWRPGQAAAGADLAAIQEAARQGAAQGAAQALSASASVSATGSLDLNAVRDAAREGVQAALQGADSQDEPVVDQEAVKNAAPRERNTLGEANAPVTIIEYSDYQCPYCLRFHTTVYPEIIEKYVKTGQVKFSFKHFPFLSEQSGIAAQAAECAAQQDRFWDYHEMLYKEREKAGQLAVTKETLIEFAGQFPLDQAAFAACLNENKSLSQVQADAEEGQKVGVRGTPSFLINGKLLVGSQPLAAFEKAIADAQAAVN
jgi:protein-disulfide isomerase